MWSFNGRFLVAQKTRRNFFEVRVVVILKKHLKSLAYLAVVRCCSSFISRQKNVIRQHFFAVFCKRANHNLKEYHSNLAQQTKDFWFSSLWTRPDSKPGLKSSKWQIPISYRLYNSLNHVELDFSSFHLIEKRERDLKALVVSHCCQHSQCDYLTKLQALVSCFGLQHEGYRSYLDL